MATLKQRMWRKNNAGTYDTIHLETESSLVLRPSGRTVEQDLTDFLPEVQATDDVPETLHFGRLHTNNKRPYIGTSDNIPARIVIESDNPLSYEIIDDEEIPPYESDADTLGGRPASDYVTNDKLEGYVKDSELEEALSGLATTAFEPYEGEEPPETLDAGKGIITTDDRLYVGSRSNKPIEVITLAHELNIGTINGKTMEQIIDYLTEQFVENKIGNVGKYDGVITGEIALGNYVDMGGYTWRVSHIDEDAKEFYLTLNTVTETTQFGSNNIYAGSTIAGKCSSFMGTMPANVINLLKMKTVNGVTAKVFIASYEQMNGGFALFNSNENRIAYDETGAAQTYWTSSPYSGNVWLVNSNGSLDFNYGPAYSNGFRPSVCLAL